MSYFGGGWISPPPKTDVDDEIVNIYFQNLSEDNMFGVKELQESIWKYFNLQMSSDIVWQLLSLLPNNMSGTIDVNECGQLFKYISDWKGMFESFDRNKEGTLSQEDLTAAFQNMGYRYSLRTNSCNLLTFYLQVFSNICSEPSEQVQPHTEETHSGQLHHHQRPDQETD